MSLQFAATTEYDFTSIGVQQLLSIGTFISVMHRIVASLLPKMLLARVLKSALMGLLYLYFMAVSLHPIGGFSIDSPSLILD